MSLSLSASSRGGFGVLAVGGAVDVHTAPDLRKAAAELIGPQSRNLVVDLTDVDFLDSSALGALVGIQKDVAAVNGVLRVVCAKPRLLRIFEITRLTEVLAIVPTVDAAVDAG